MTVRIPARAALVLLAGSLGGCFSSSGGGGEAPARTYVVLPSGQTVPAQTTTTPPN